MSNVHFASADNSTIFTKCCNVAICDDQRCCPVCKVEIAGSGGSRFTSAMVDWYGAEGYRKMVAGYKK